MPIASLKIMSIDSGNLGESIEGFTSFTAAIILKPPKYIGAEVHQYRAINLLVVKYRTPKFY